MSSNAEQATPTAESNIVPPEKSSSQAEHVSSQRESAKAAMKEMAIEGREALSRAGHAIAKPVTGAAIAGSAAIAAAVIWGAAEAAVGAGAAYVVYRMLRHRKHGPHEHEEDTKRAA